MQSLVAKTSICPAQHAEPCHTDSQFTRGGWVDGMRVNNNVIMSFADVTQSMHCLSVQSPHVLPSTRRRAQLDSKCDRGGLQEYRYQHQHDGAEVVATPKGRRRAHPHSLRPGAWSGPHSCAMRPCLMRVRVVAAHARRCPPARCSPRTRSSEPRI